MPEDSNMNGSFRRLIDIGVALSAEKDSKRLMEHILLEAQDMSNADGGTLYILKDNALVFEIFRPCLRVHQLPLVVFHTWPFRRISLSMAVVSLTHPQEIGCELEKFTRIQSLRGNRP